MRDLSLRHALFHIRRLVGGRREQQMTTKNQTLLQDRLLILFHTVAFLNIGKWR